MNFHCRHRFPNSLRFLTIGFASLPFFWKAQASDLPDFSTFHSNLGVQEIVEVGVPIKDLEESKIIPAQSPPPKAVLPSTPVESEKEIVREESPRVAQKAPRTDRRKSDAPGIWERGETRTASSQPPAVPTVSSSSSETQISAQSGLRAYHTSNVLRTAKEVEERSGVFEANVMTSVSAPDIRVGDYYVLLPRLDMMMQWAQYQEMGDLLDYRFALIKGGLGLAMPNDWNLGFSLDYNLLHNMSSGDKTFDAWSPALTAQKVYSVFENSFLMLDATARQSNTEQSVVFPAAGIFADSGDNLQNSFSVTLVHPFDEEGQLLFMPRISWSRTSYQNSPNSDRLDYLFSGGANLTYRWRDFLDLQGFMSYSSMSSDTIDDFEVYDLGLALSGNYRF